MPMIAPGVTLWPSQSENYLRVPRIVLVIRAEMWHIISGSFFAYSMLWFPLK